MSNDMKDYVDAIGMAYALYDGGWTPSYSTLIDGKTISCGYGKLDYAGDYEFPLVIDQKTLKVIGKFDAS